MDAKSLAKSKRAHSLHHSKKPHSYRKPKPLPGSGSAGGGDGVSGSKSSEKPVKDRERATSSALPSNWDRYEDEFDLGSEEMSTGSTSKTSDIMLPKSKGADYRHLLAEAQSQPLPSGYFDRSFSLDDVLPDEFKCTLGPMLSARGEGILSWILDDNFIVEDEIGATASPEASFLSLNLHALEEQLAKVDISKRLFLEPDIFPPELCDDGSRVTSSQGSTTQQMPEHSGPAHVDVSEKDDKNVIDVADAISDESTSTADDYLKPNLLQGPQTSAPLKDNPESQFNDRISSATSATSKLKNFEAASAEAELDMLLDSFGDTKLTNQSTSTSVTFPVWLEPNATVLPSIARNVPSDIDDLLDDLLEETSSVLNHSRPYQHANVKDPKLPSPGIESSSSQPVSKSEVLDDFGSWLDSM